jgi:hypothetical protein
MKNFIYVLISFVGFALCANLFAKPGVKFGGNSVQGQNPLLVILQDTTYGSSGQIAIKKADNDSVLAYLQTTGYAYDVMYRDTSQTTVPSFQAYRSLFLIETSNISVSRMRAAFRDSLKSFLASGTSEEEKSLIVFGGDFGYNYEVINVDTTLTRTWMHFQYLGDDGSVIGQDKITGVSINTGLSDSLIRTAPSFYPDFVRPLENSIVLYQHAGRGSVDSVAGVGYDGPTYNTAAIFVDPRYVTSSEPGGGNARVFSGVFNFIESVGGEVPVELTSFIAAVNQNAVTLTWHTATETNNEGFEVERSKVNDQNSKGEWETIKFVEGYGTTSERKSYTFIDKNVEVGSYVYRLKQIDFDGSFAYSENVEAEILPPAKYYLHQNFPNPFNPATQIKFSVLVEGYVTLTVHSALGEKIAEIFSGDVQAGSHEVLFDASNLSSGVYYYRIETKGFNSVKKMMLLK